MTKYRDSGPFALPVNQEAVFQGVSALLWVIITAFCGYYALLFWGQKDKQTLVLRKPKLTLIAGLGFNLFGLASILELVFPWIPCSLNISLQQLLFAVGISALTMRNFNLYFMMNVTIAASKYVDVQRRSALNAGASSSVGFFLKNRWLSSNAFLYRMTAFMSGLGLIPTIVSFFLNLDASANIYSSSIDNYAESGYLCNQRFYLEWTLPGICVAVALLIPALIFLILIFDKQHKTGLVSDEVFLQEESTYLSFILLLHIVAYPTLGFLQYKADVDSDLRKIPLLELESILAATLFFWFTVIYPYMMLVAREAEENEQPADSARPSTTINAIEGPPAGFPDGSPAPQPTYESVQVASMKLVDRRSEMEAILNTAEGCEDMENFMKMELAVENLYFWRAAKEFRAAYFRPEIPAWKVFDRAMKDHLETIFREFIEYNSPLQLNLQRAQVEQMRNVICNSKLDSDVSEDVEKALWSIEKEIINIMTHNVYKRWLRTEKSKTIRTKALRTLASSKDIFENKSDK